MGESDDARYVGQRIDVLREAISTSSTATREAISASGASVHARLDGLSLAIEASMERAVQHVWESAWTQIEPLIPKQRRAWQQHPYDWMAMVAFLWVLVVATGAIMTLGFLPDRLLDDLQRAVSSYMSAVSVAEATGP